MTKQERYKKSVEFLRTFAKKVNTLSQSGLSNKDFSNNVRGLLRTYGNQWPNWLDDDIESVPGE